MALKQYLIALASISLFTIAILSFAVDFAEDNDAEVKISEEEGLTNLQTNVGENVSNFRGGSEDTYKSIIASSIDAGSETTPSGGAFALTPWTLLKPIKNIFEVAKVQLFGDKFAIFFTTLFAIMVTIMIFYIYKAWVGKMPD